MSSPYTLRPATFTELPSVAHVWTSAFFDDEIIGQIMHPHRREYPDDVYYFLLRGIRERFWDWRHQFLVVTVNENEDEKVGSERLVGAADWRRLGKGGEGRELNILDPSKYRILFWLSMLKTMIREW